VLSGMGVRKIAKTVSDAYFTGRATLQVRATGKTKAHLQTTHKVRVAVRVTFTPLGGSPSSQSKTVRLFKGQ
jgi:hypothetical protein